MIGPFEPPRKVSVPIWIACALKKRRKCRIVAPHWMALGEPLFTYLYCAVVKTRRADRVPVEDHLEALLKDEVTQPGFSALPFRYMETARLLLDR